MMGHDMVARVVPEFAITEPEARLLAGKFCAYARHYSMFSDVDPRTRDLRLLLAAIVVMEGPRLYRAVNRRAAEKVRAKAHAQAQAQASGGVIVDIDGFRTT